MASDAAAAIDPTPGRQPHAEPWTFDGFLRWLTRYDPLPFFSALCVLVGIWLIAGDLGKEDWVAGKLWLILVTQSYEWCLIAGAALLVRAGRLRSAAVLGLLESFFLLDNVFNTQVMPHLEGLAWWISSLWLALVVVKAEWLIRCLRLRLPRDLRSFVYGLAGLIAWVPQILDDTPRRLSEVVFLSALGIACSLLGLALRGYGHPDAFGSRLLPDPADSADPAGTFDEYDEVRRRVRRCGDALLVLWTALFLAHMVSWMTVFDLDGYGYFLFPPALTMLIAARREGFLWTAAFGALAASRLLPEDPHLGLFCFHWAVTGLVAYFLIRRAIELRTPRLAVPGVLAASWCIHFFLPYLIAPSLSYAVAGSILLALAVAFREPLAGSVAAAMAYMAAQHFGLLDRLGWGVVTLAVGFLTLALAVAAQLRQAARQPPGAELRSPDA